MSESEYLWNYMGPIKRTCKKRQLMNDDLKRPQAPFFLFCTARRNSILRKGQGNKLSAHELGEMWKNLPEEKKQLYKDKYKKDKLEYDNSKNKSKNKNNYNNNKRKQKNNKVKVIPGKDSINKNNIKVCNCGICPYCKEEKEKIIKKEINNE